MGLTWGPPCPRWAPCWSHEPCYQGCVTDIFYTLCVCDGVCQFPGPLTSIKLWDEVIYSFPKLNGSTVHLSKSLLVKIPLLIDARVVPHHYNLQESIRGGHTVCHPLIWEIPTPHIANGIAWLRANTGHRLNVTYLSKSHIMKNTAV